MSGFIDPHSDGLLRLHRGSSKSQLSPCTAIRKEMKQASSFERDCHALSLAPELADIADGAKFTSHTKITVLQVGSGTWKNIVTLH